MSVLAEEVLVAGRPLRNRIVATAHGTASVVDGMPTAADAAYWRRLAQGGPGLVVTGGISVSAASTLRARYLGEAWHDHAAEAYREKASAITSNGAVALAQLCHLGRETLGAATFLPFEAPSPVRSPREPAMARTLTVDDCAEVVASFVTSACRMVDAGFDGIELHAAHGYLLAQFLDPATNLRTDRYGGDRGGRARIVLEIVEGIRACRPGAIVSLRLSPSTDPAGMDLAELCRSALFVQERSPVDLVSLSYGSRLGYTPDMATARPPLAAAEAAPTLRELRAGLGVPLLVGVSFRDRADLETMVEDGRADLVGMARPHLADPDVTTKLLTGRDDEVRPCVSCNEDCRAFDPVVLCVVNPDLAPPGERARPAAPQRVGPSTSLRSGIAVGGAVAVVGAGPAGLETALTIALARPDVTVVVHDRADRLGGQLLTATAGGTRPGWSRLLRYYEGQLARAGVRLRLGSDVTGALGVPTVWAAGAVEESAPTGRVTSTRFLVDPSLRPSRPVVVDDGFGWWPALSSVELAFDRGAEVVTLVTAAPSLGAAVPADSRAQLLRRLRGRALDVLALTEVVGSTPTGVTVRSNGSPGVREVHGDAVVQVGLRTALPAPDHADWAVGDCISPRRVAHAVAEGRELGRRLAGTPD
ncbi:2,4-dienoyl-CoA reductase-like NADH-dependent reductase (Old Yellow Enzyme family) [Nocardioides zeae]|uniref:2,4-dienoyl-CoA reductase-like NADH-dependent reductase (Old Yellow Enzyme family) n=1 Tax=Nocardioides zeae TaxID=1457234 RepID=A0ACC6INK1_9ACTN|nr:NAD(P)-binding protein [Nocardioides zeae]MDR6173742.1 2,4-dienoyl-CoA reductase-like NADH-dependent reductase (Old Yellow Enzyme family) [Nocardioides zeae]MDR6212228.1 2,4-dienoyl-CoA reductase-like NADH-dependent reductase (Old Yellow Enzyme family) [Nocardioides zeae]